MDLLCDGSGIWWAGPDGKEREEEMVREGKKGVGEGRERRGNWMGEDFCGSVLYR